MGIGHAVVQHAASTSDWIAAASVLVALLPRRFDDARWSGPGGEEIPGQSGPAMAPELVGAGEDEQPSSYLSKVLQRVGRRDHPVAFLTFTVPVPDEGEHGVPVRFKANADELADDEAEPALDRVFVIRRRSD